MRVRFLAQARADLHQIVASFEDEPGHAAAVLNQIEADAALLSRFPRRFAVVAGTGLGEIRKMRSPPYLLLYRVGPDDVQILAVAHERSDWVSAVAKLG